MFFNSNIKIAAEIAVAVERCLAMALSSARYNEGSCESLPAPVWQDVYIAAFTHHLVCLFVKYDFDGRAWPQKKREAVFMMVLQNLCGAHCKTLVESVEKGVRSPEHKYEFERAISDAASLYLAATNRLKPEDDTPIIREAKLFISKNGKSGNNVSLSGKDLASTICALTIGRRISEKYA